MSSAPQQWLLWAFPRGSDVVLTRGRTVSEAAGYVAADPHSTLPFLPIDAARLYTRTHPFDWLNIPPLWYQARTREWHPSTLRWLGLEEET